MEYTKTEEYDTPIKIFYGISFVALVLIGIAGKTASTFWVLSFIALAGVGLIAFVPFAFSSLSETTFPAEETAVITLQMVIV